MESSFFSNLPDIPVSSQGKGTQAIKEAFQTASLVLRVVIILLLIGFLCSGIRNIEQFEKGVILRFGAVKEVREEPGLILALPFPIDEVIKIPARRTHTYESTTFWYQEGDVLDMQSNGYLLTSDRHIIHARGIVKYHIQDIIAYMSVSSEGKKIIASFLANALMKASCAMNVAEVMKNRNAFTDLATRILREQLSRLNFGIEIDPLELRIHWPKQLSESIEDITKANQEYHQAITNAKGYAKQKADEAESQYASIQSTAVTWATQKLGRINADSETFRKLYPLYQKNPQVIRNILYQDRIRTIAAHLDEVFIMKSDSNQEIRISLSRKKATKDTE